MAELDFLIISDYVRAENGLLHMIAGGLDTISASAVPAVRNVGIGLSLKLPRAEMTEHHTLRLIFHDADGARIAEVGADLPARSDAADTPPGRKISFVAALNMCLPIPGYGDYSLELLVDGDRKKEIPIHVVRPAETRPLVTAVVSESRGGFQ